MVTGCNKLWELKGNKQEWEFCQYIYDQLKIFLIKGNFSRRRIETARNVCQERVQQLKCTTFSISTVIILTKSIPMCVITISTE
jgi:hypothetical protein